MSNILYLSKVYSFATILIMIDVTFFSHHQLISDIEIECDVGSMPLIVFIHAEGMECSKEEGNLCPHSSAQEYEGARPRMKEEERVR